MDIVLAGMNFEICLAYLDDIIVFSRDGSSHLLRLRKLFDKLRQANLKLKLSKCRLLQMKLSFLGFIVSEEGVSIDPSKIDAIRNCPKSISL